jgi:uncharacterized repeat protein (TIGR04138 family)
MPPGGDSIEEMSLQEIVDQLDRYPIAAFLFLEQGLQYSVNLIHGEVSDPDPDVSRHITGPQLCEGLRAYALAQWGMLARVVLARWRINSTFDFGRMVFAMIEGGRMRKTETDSIDDFRNVYDFKTAFDGSYQIGSPA